MTNGKVIRIVADPNLFFPIKVSQEFRDPYVDELLASFHNVALEQLSQWYKSDVGDWEREVRFIGAYDSCPIPLSVDIYSFKDQLFKDEGLNNQFLNAVVRGVVLELMKIKLQWKVRATLTVMAGITLHQTNL